MIYLVILTLAVGYFTLPIIMNGKSKKAIKVFYWIAIIMVLTLLALELFQQYH